PAEGDGNRSRWPTDPTWRVVQGATFAEAPAEARRVIRRRQRGADVAVLDRGLYGYLVSRVALRHPNGGGADRLASAGRGTPRPRRPRGGGGQGPRRVGAPAPLPARTAGAARNEGVALLLEHEVQADSGRSWCLRRARGAGGA